MTDRRVLGLSVGSWVAVWVWAALVLGVLGRAAFASADSQSVVPVYLKAGERWLAGDGLYALRSGELDVYRNPPGVAALFAALSLLPAKPAALLWRVLGIGLFAGGLRHFLRHAAPDVRTDRQRSDFWIVAAVVVLLSFNNGQVNLFIVAGVVWGVALAAEGRWWAAAFGFAFATWLKIYPLAAGLLACVVEPTKLGWRMAIALAVLFGLAFVCQHPQYVWDRHVEMAQTLQEDDRTAGGFARCPRDWTMIPRVWFGVAMPRQVTLPVACLSGVGLAACVYLRRRTADVWPRVMCLGLLWLTLFGPATELNTYGLLAPAVAWACVCGWAHRWQRALVALAATALVVPILRGMFPPSWGFQLLEVPALSGLALLAAVVTRPPVPVASPASSSPDRPDSP